MFQLFYFFIYVVPVSNINPDQYNYFLYGVLNKVKYKRNYKIFAYKLQAQRLQTVFA